MPLDEYKTQVLLLHSEQNTLDDLSSGFGDRYTVHCATSGTEALNTLVDTPINVIITAHDLPGMSGLDALREAKKRSPDTIGILLAGNSTKNIEALVGDEEVFQVVSGSVTGDGLLRLVENATRQMRLMALAESANDTTADVDHSAEHIIMETSENGSTIISDGTGRLPVLDPKKVSEAASVGSRAVDILVLTQDQEFLETIKDSSRGMHKVYYANTLGQANEAIRKHKIGVAVVDAAMVGEKIEQLTQHLRENSPRLVSIVAGRRDDGEMLMDLINRGKVYRFLLKPVSPGRARLAVESSVKHHLEAPDAAFKSKGIPAAPKPIAAKPAPQPVAKPAPAPTSAAKVAPKPTPKPAPKPAAAPAAKSSPAAAASPAPADPPFGSVSRPEGSSPIEDGLADAFGQNESSFTETVTGLFSSVSKKFSSDETKEAAVKKLPVKDKADIERPASASVAGDFGSGGSLIRNPKVMGIGAAAIVVSAVVVFWSMSGSDEPQDPPAEAPGTPATTVAEVVVDEAPLVADAVDVEAILETAESAMLEARFDAAAGALQRVADIDPQNARLPFLNAQLAQMQLRGRLDEARIAIRENRFEDAGSELSAARNLDVADTTEIEIIAAELSAARSAQQSDDVLAKAADRLNAGDLLSPANDNARYYYELVLSNDAGNTAARQGLSVVAGKLAFQARTEIDNGNLQAAEDILADARAMDPTNADVESTVTALANVRAAVIEQQRRAEDERVAAAERQAAAERKAEAERQAAADRQVEAERQAEADRLAKEEQAATDAEEQAVAATQATTSAIIDSANDTAVSDEGEEVAAAVDDAGVASPAKQLSASEPAQAEQVVEQRPVTISSLNRIKYVAPKYPRSAQRRNLSGWVDVVFTVTTDGTVKDVSVYNSEPGDTFVNSAVKAVEKWKFEPVVENGVLVEKVTGVRMMFALE